MLKIKDKADIYLEEFKGFINCDQYISKKDKISFQNRMEPIIKKINGIAYSNHYTEVKKIIDHFDKLIEIRNKTFVNRKLEEYRDYFDHLFDEVDSNICLDEEQRRAILIDEDYTMIIAGAGAGKTTTMAAKVKYLVEKLHINPHEIMLISFTNQAVNELKDRIQKDFKIPCKICTFHKFGIDVMKENTEEPLQVSLNSYSIVKSYFEQKLLYDNKNLEQFLKFFAFYFDVPEYAMKFKNLEEYINYKKRTDFETLKSKLKDYNDQVLEKRKDDYITAKGEFLRSMEEVMIANFLYLNQVEYGYELPYPFGSITYAPDFTIYSNEKIYYLEHFGVSQKGYNNRYNKKSLLRYRNIMERKQQIHKKYQTEMIQTFSSYEDGRSILDHLKEELEKRNIPLKERNPKEIYEMLLDTNRDIYFGRFINFCLAFIQGFKTKNYQLEDFKRLKEENKENERIIFFLKFVENVYIYYQEQLKKNHWIDFEDMINEAYQILCKVENVHLDYKYIIIDEYQDISASRFDLTKKVSEISNAKVIAVGDDWQAIFSFSGSDVSLFTLFKDLMGYAEQLQITRTYRNSQELIDIAGKFVMQNDFQIKKKLISKKRLDKPVKLVSYDDCQNKLENKIKTVVECIRDIINHYGDFKNILLIGRYNFDKNKLLDSEFFYELEGALKCTEFPNVSLDFLTAHSSKGLGYDNVIIINGEDHTYGFPSKVKSDPIMDLVATKSDSFKYSEERRLFYVALTRTKNNVYIVYPSSSPSAFVKEIETYKNVFKIDVFKNKKEDKICPKCKTFYLKKYFYNHYHISNLYICTNEKEVCGFMTNHLKYKKEIQACSCGNGYLIVKQNKKDGNYFIGCTAYKSDGSGCNYTKRI